LVLTLIDFGMCGMPFALHIGGLINRSLNALVGSEQSAQGR
jgi:hypothetical protein